MVLNTDDLCPHISISSVGNSTYDGMDTMVRYWYEKYIFGTYRFESFDARGNAIYHAKIGNKDRFLVKSTFNTWLVSMSCLCFNKYTIFMYHTKVG